MLNILGFNCIHNCSGYNIGYKILRNFENLIKSDEKKKSFVVDYLSHLAAVK